MASSPRTDSVRARGARRLTQATVGMVVVGIGGVTALAVHDAQISHASTNPAKGTTTTTVSTKPATDNSSSTATDDTSSSSSSSTSSGVSTSNAPAQATSGGS